jgi:hypothetical protein
MSDTDLIGPWVRQFLVEHIDERQFELPLGDSLRK